MRKLLLLFVMFFATQLSFAQLNAEKLKENMKTASFKQKFETANSLMEDQLFHLAAMVWENLLEEQPNNANVNYKAGVSYLNMSNDRMKALPYLEKASTNISKKYDPFSHAETKAPVETYFYLGRGQHLAEKMDDAIVSFQKFLAEVSKKHILYPKAELEIIMCNNAKIEMASPKRFIIKNIGPEINGPYADFSPVITLDQSALFFTSRRLRADSVNINVFSPQDGGFFEDVYVSYKSRETGKWGEPILLDFSSPRRNEATIGVSGDGQMLFIYQDVQGGNIFVSQNEGENYGSLEGLGSNINSDYWETHATISADGKTLYFVSDRPGGLGGRDIYRCVKLPNGDWSNALNIGAPINSKYDEDAPFFHPDGKTIFFSSNNEKSMGGFDIFFSQMQSDGSWSEPVNLGYPLNTVDDDIFFMTTADGKTGYFSSAREGGYGEKDIYVISMDTVYTEPVAILKGFIISKPGERLPPSTTIWVTNLTEGGDPIDYKPRTRDGGYVLNLKPCNEYLVEYQVDDRTFYETQIVVPCDADYHEINQVIRMEDISIDGVVVSGDPKEEPKGEPKEDILTYLVKYNSMPYDKVTKAKYLDEKGKILFQEVVTNGKFTYREMPKNKKTILELDVEDITLCDKFEVILVDKDANIKGKTVRDVNCKLTTTLVSDGKTPKDDKTPKEVVPEKAEFKKYYGYNQKGVTAENKEYQAFIKKVLKMIDSKGFVEIEIEGSASEVPTQTFGTNENLANKRVEVAREMIMTTLKTKGVSPDKIKIVAESAIVSGPKYAKDPQNRTKYGKFQYIKISIK
ncbi:MAG: hypothetical protein ACK4K0_00500 [Flavobacteriales bacterium]